MKKRTVSTGTKQSILKRDNYTCQYCGYDMYDMTEVR